MHISDGSHRKKLTLLLLALMAVSAALSACGGGGSSAPSASASGGGESSSLGASSPQFRWELKFTHCLRGQGISVADPDPVKGAPSVEHDAAYLAASKTCVQQIGEPPSASSSTDSAAEMERLDAELKMAKCLRAHGVDAADPSPDEALTVPEGTSSKVLVECTSGSGK
jgi:hypothetical protein